MLGRYSKLNKFGRQTWLIKLDSIFKIELHEVSDNKFLIELKERGFLSSKVVSSLYSENQVYFAIIEAYDHIYQYFKTRADIQWTEDQKNKKLLQVLTIYEQSYGLPYPDEEQQSDTYSYEDPFEDREEPKSVSQELIDPFEDEKLGYKSSEDAGIKRCEIIMSERIDFYSFKELFVKAGLVNEYGENSIPSQLNKLFSVLYVLFTFAPTDAERRQELLENRYLTRYKDNTSLLEDTMIDAFKTLALPKLSSEQLINAMLITRTEHMNGNTAGALAKAFNIVKRNPEHIEAWEFGSAVAHEMEFYRLSYYFLKGALVRLLENYSKDKELLYSDLVFTLKELSYDLLGEEEYDPLA